MSAAEFLIPVKKYTRLTENFTIPSDCVLASASVGDILALNQLAEAIGPKAKARVVLNAYGPATVRISKDHRLDKEAYRINITKDEISIFASTRAGAYYAVQTLLDLISQNGNKLPCCAIEDKPDFVRRGVYLDCSRGKVPTVETVKSLIERLAHWKINELQLYIENVFTFTRHPAIGKGHSSFTPEDLLELQAFCNLHNIKFVGSLASFGHTEKILMLPEYTHLGEMPGFRNLPGGTMLSPVDPGSIKLMAELYDEFVPLFDAVDFNACGDEPWELGKGRSKKRADKVGAGQVYIEYFLKLYELCQKHGKRMNAWADIVLQHPEILGQVPKDCVMLNWDYNPDGSRIPRTKEIADAELPLMVCPGTSSWNTHGTRLQNAVDNVAVFAKEGLKYGAEGLLNTDWGDNGHRNMLGVSLHGFAHGAAHSWNSRAVDDKAFTAAFCKHTFGAEVGAKLVKPLKMLGSTYQTCGAPYRNESALFYTLYEPFAKSKAIDPSRIDLVDARGTAKVIEQLEDSSIWPEPCRGMDEFEAIALREFKLAAQMDVFAARRALIGKRIRNGEQVNGKELRSLAADMGSIAGQFKKLWLARNRKSRLGDNMKLFKQVGQRLEVRGS